MTSLSFIAGQVEKLQCCCFHRHRSSTPSKETPIIKGHYFGFGTLPHPGQPSSPASLDQEEQLRITKEKIALADEKIAMANEKFVRLKNDKADQGKVMKQISELVDEDATRE
ncbi:hypothetical protein Bca101_008925 [Brassica carinata]